MESSVEYVWQCVECGHFHERMTPGTFLVHPWDVMEQLFVFAPSEPQEWEPCVVCECTTLALLVPAWALREA